MRFNCGSEKTAMSKQKSWQKFLPAFIVQFGWFYGRVIVKIGDVHVSQ